MTIKITASLVKELRERTGSGMMECKKALVASNGDIDVAIDEMRKSGMAKAGKKSDRTAAEGCIAINITDDAKQAVMIEINCETDFVTKGDDFQQFADAVSAQALSKQPADLDALLALPLNDGNDLSIEDARKALIAKIGENVNVRRFISVTSNGLVASYSHGDQIGVLVALDNGSAELGKDIAMHVAASKPAAISEKDIPAQQISDERAILISQATAESEASKKPKPAEIIEKMVEGRIRKYMAEITLYGQPFVKDPDVTVGQLVEKTNSTVTQIMRFEVGEGIEKKEDNFAEEVMAQARGV